MKILTKEQLLSLLPVEFRTLDFDATYSLQKISAKRENSFVLPGDAIVGSLEVIQVPTTEKPGIRVQAHAPWNYMRTSPVERVVDATETSLTFETEGGVYQLVKLNFYEDGGRNTHYAMTI